ncbi:MAG TPA: hypothetical protein VEU11_14375 [Terriglobales bacterium]|nr:hypothetical protein [Terriglobales bacterium]
MRPISVFLCTVLWMWCARAQDAPADTNQTSPVYRVTVVSRTTKAINYGHLTAPTKVGLKGTVLLPEAQGEARVQSRRGNAEIEVKVNHLGAPSRFGSEYLTYILWAMTPEGRPVNLGELVTDPSNKAHIRVSTDLQAFALIVTAEPYFSVMQPSAVVVMENVVEHGTLGQAEEVDAKYELLPRKPFIYNMDVPPAGSGGQEVSMAQYEALLAVYQAQNAIQIAKAAGAEHYAADSIEKAERLYRQALEMQSQKADKYKIVTVAREAAQTAEDARAISVKRQQSEGIHAAVPRS